MLLVSQLGHLSAWLLTYQLTYLLIYLLIYLSICLSIYLSQIGSKVVKAFAFLADGLGFNSPSGYKVGRPGHSK